MESASHQTDYNGLTKSVLKMGKFVENMEDFSDNFHLRKKKRRRKN